MLLEGKEILSGVESGKREETKHADPNESPHFYADDAVLIARTPAGLKHLLDFFIDFIEALDLSTNFSKLRTMVVESKKKDQEKYFGSGTELTRAKLYQGVLSDERGAVRSPKEEYIVKSCGDDF
ncbi:hypothetical protein NDU88_000747 [Pleurodeles waltl]|uniref:Reverse transcriptase n=1 Tax=Pleurodeles waltl TaxID=8319 RepID=A0AAV7MHQ0_PLEWA|nr:hypothetical protein NDU88_000747 [Pleurodeles waltl]